MKLLLARHCQTDWNREPARCQGWAEVELNEAGRAQARDLGRALEGRGVELIVTSHLVRARETAEIILAGRDVPLSIDARLNERRSGLDGQPAEAFNGLVRPDPVRIRPVNGESFLEQMARLQGFLDEVALRHRDGVVLAVSHENPILAAAALAGRDMEEAARGSLGNCEWLLLEWPS